jgi:hypothetical protein
MEKGLNRIRKILADNCSSNHNLQNFFNEFIEKELYVGHYSDELKALIDKYSIPSVDKNEN